MRQRLKSLGAVHTHTHTQGVLQTNNRTTKLNRKENLIKKIRENYTFMSFNIKSRDNSLFSYYYDWKHL